MSNKNKPEDIWKRINKKETNECWEWTGSCDTCGYGQMKVNGKKYNTHRLIYELTYGTIPKRLCVLHHCDNRKCCNPSHLFLGTHTDNVRDMIHKGRRICCQVLTVDNVKEIRKVYFNSDISYAQLAKQYRVHAGTIGDIIRRKSWKNI